MDGTTPLTAATPRAGHAQSEESRRPLPMDPRGGVLLIDAFGIRLPLAIGNKVLNDNADEVIV